jgi:hypothetical protein
VQDEYFNAQQRSTDEHYTIDSDPAKDTTMRKERRVQSHDGCILAHASRIDPSRLHDSSFFFFYLDGTRVEY